MAKSNTTNNGSSITTEELINEVKKEKKKISILEKRFRNQTSTYLITILILVGAFIWNEVLKDFLKYYLHFDECHISNKIVTAIFYTLISFILIFYVIKNIDHLDDDDEDDKDELSLNSSVETFVF